MVASLIPSAKSDAFFSRSACVQPAVVLALLLLIPVAALAQGSPFDTGFTAIQSLFTGTIAKVASLVAIVIGGYGFAHGEPGAKKALGRCRRRNRHCRSRRKRPELALGRVGRAPTRQVQQMLNECLMPDNTEQKHRTNRVFKSLHKPLTYLGVERTLFYFVCVGAVGAFNLFNSILAGIAVFIGGFAFGHWVTNSDPAFLRILAKSERYKLRYDAAKQQVPRVEVV